MSHKLRERLILLLAAGAILLTCLGHGDGAFLCVVGAAVLLLWT